ncbi:MAG TPA: glucose-6-phosphate dehydrogenase, partial [Gemmatimonadales bacterium]|nr:glucose-6-phosphate dehydrogenase [Gemmatimonadales bacterium]
MNASSPQVDPFDLVIFGGTGDLAMRKLLPALLHRYADGQIQAGSRVIGVAREGLDDEGYRAQVREALAGSHARLEEFLGLVHYRPLDARKDEGWKEFAELIAAEPGHVRVFYLSIPPSAFPVVTKQLARSGLAQADEQSWRRVVIEKPFGHDLASAKELNGIVNDVFPEESVFRIDHYLGKETVQNILALRFANQLFEPIWNANYVDHVQITMAEDIGLGGRAGYYDGIGAARDVIQNHLLQLMALTAMEEPLSFHPRDLRAEKVKVLSATKAVTPFAETTARGQYLGGWQGGLKVPGLHEEGGFAKDSLTETYAAITLEVDTRRWAGVPFYLRTGKRLGRRVTEIAVVFKRAPHLPFDSTATDELGQNALVVRVQPDEGVTIRFGSKVPGNQMEVRDVSMDFGYGHAFTESSPEAYERLILDMLLGEPSLFPVNDEVELSWEILDPVLRSWATSGRPDPYD